MEPDGATPAPRREQVKNLRWSYRIGRLAGIDVYVHVTFLVLLAWIGLSRLLGGHGLASAALAVALMGTVFGIVVLHELGHALAARSFGIPTRDITLLPIGGVARLQRMPERPSQELVVAAAGPAVNLVLGALAWLALWLAEGLPATLPSVVLAEFLEWMLVANVALLAFNLLPAFPMDGGRILRALLAFRKPFLQATEIAVRVGRVFAVLLGVAGLFYNPMLVLIAFFVWFGGGSELAMVRAREAAASWVPDSPHTGHVAGERVVFVPGPAGWRAVRIVVGPPPQQPPSVRIVDIR